MIEPQQNAQRQINDPLEVKLAGEVQNLLMPKSSPQCSWCSMAAKNRMANVLGGDFYDFIKLDDGCQILFVGDVTGHGLHASVVMSLVYGFIHRASNRECNPREVVADLNTFLRTFAVRSTRLDHFFSATLFFGVIDPTDLSISYVNAGHPAGLVLRDDELIRLPATSHPVGYFDRANFRVETFCFQAHDRFLLYTDGLLDSSNSNGEMFGSKRLDQACCAIKGDPISFLQQLFDMVDEHLAGQSPFDDSTAIVMDLHDILSKDRVK